MLRLYIYTIVSATLAQVQTMFSFRRTTPNIYVSIMPSLYRVNILFKCIWGLRNIQRKYCSYNFKCIVIMQNCWTHITVINARWLNFTQHFIFGVPKIPNRHSYGRWYDHLPSVLNATKNSLNYNKMWKKKKMLTRMLPKVSPRVSQCSF